MVAELLKRMSELDIRIDDYKHVAMCREYNELMAKGEKKSTLAEYSPRSTNSHKALCFG